MISILSRGRQHSFFRKFCILGVVRHGIVPLCELNAQYHMHASWYMKIYFFSKGVKQKALIGQTLAILSALFGCGNVHMMCWKKMLVFTELCKQLYLFRPLGDFPEGKLEFPGLNWWQVGSLADMLPGFRSQICQKDQFKSFLDFLNTTSGRGVSVKASKICVCTQ